ncbi:MAG: hypothetical protein ACRBN8_19705 [Nannocystales bacterium]
MSCCCLDPGFPTYTFRISLTNASGQHTTPLDDLGDPLLPVFVVLIGADGQEVAPQSAPTVVQVLDTGGAAIPGQFAMTVPGPDDGGGSPLYADAGTYQVIWSWQENEAAAANEEMECFEVCSPGESFEVVTCGGGC